MYKITGVQARGTINEQKKGDVFINPDIFAVKPRLITSLLQTETWTGVDFSSVLFHPKLEI